MSSEAVISVCDASKIYRAYDHPLHALLARVTGGHFGRYQEFHALRNINFEVRRGESVGIVGRNGSGKSTLLQLICGIRQPTSGTVTVTGRISALLELGSGFHPDFTGRENIFMQGAIVGLDRREMEERFDYIAAFADIGEYLEQPVRTYSTGMTMRLAFAVATSIDPEILVVDEALAVGDTAFQVRCMNRMQELIDSGVTMLFVSHNAYQVQRMCKRAIYLAEGIKRMDGHPFEILPRYESDLLGDMRPVPKTGVLNPLFRFIDACCDTSNNIADTKFYIIHEGQPLVITMRYTLAADLQRGLQIGFLLKCVDGFRVLGETSNHATLCPPTACGEHAVRVIFAPNLLLAGNYTFSMSAFDSSYIEQYGFVEHALALHVVASGSNPLHRIGSVALPHEWQVVA
ncbi:MAG: ABC transporter ATP-binding protein [Accumulibacter sp.]|jgi:ABC-type polysaccharide/polyol phosphate transport system ATPase subunit|uniref:ABC transporter ATP-binding protein n=1 Tax=Accumulibacter sp. TaxID=2053492 RepID=UPI002FC37AAD